MRQFAGSLPVIFVSALAVFAVATLKSQDNVSGSPQTWEYATVIGFTEPKWVSDGLQTTFKSDVRICFASDTGCRNEIVEMSYDLAKGSNAAQRFNQAFSKAAARLGAEGWELTSTLGINQDGGTSHVQMYFRKPMNRR